VLGYFDYLEQDAVLNQALQTTFKKSRWENDLLIDTSNLGIVASSVMLTHRFNVNISAKHLHLCKRWD